MNEETPPTTSPHVYHPASLNCPRCNKPMKARVTASVSKVHLIICTGCSWQIPVEEIRKRIKLVAFPVEPQNPEDAPGDEF